MNDSRADLPSGTSPWIVDIDARNFEREVVERSRSLPVLAYFGASWSEACNSLAALLEKKAREGQGRFLLARIDVDQNPELTQAMRVQGVPAVLAIVDGRLANGFQGVADEARIDALLDELAPGAGPSPVEEAKELAQAGQVEEAIALLRGTLREHPEGAQAADMRIALAGILVEAGKSADARKVFDKLDEAARARPEARLVQSQLEFSESAGDLAELEQAVRAEPDSAQARIELGKAYVAGQRHEEGLEMLLEAVRLQRAQGGGEAKQAMLEVFEILGLDDPLANDYRFKLSMELFS